MANMVNHLEFRKGGALGPRQWSDIRGDHHDHRRTAGSRRARAKGEVPMNPTPGFGANFYGYFVYAAVWIAGCFLLVRYLNRGDRK